MQSDALVPANLSRAHIASASRIVIFTVTNVARDENNANDSATVADSITLAAPGGDINVDADKISCLITMLLENRLATFNPKLIGATTSELSSPNSLFLLGPARLLFMNKHPFAPSHASFSIDEEMGEGWGKESSLDKRRNVRVKQLGNGLGWIWAPRYASGRVLFSNLITRLLAQTFFTPSLLALVDTITKGSHMRLRSIDTSTSFSHIIRGVMSWSSLFFAVVLDTKTVPLGLYRDQNGVQYVYANPGMDSVITHTDSVYVLTTADLD